MSAQINKAHDIAKLKLATNYNLTQDYKQHILPSRIYRKQHSYK